MHGGGLGKQGPQGGKLGLSMAEGRGLVNKELGSISGKLKVLVCVLATPQGAHHSVIYCVTYSVPRHPGIRGERGTLEVKVTIALEVM